MRLDLTERELFLLYYISKGYLAPVDKLLTKDEVEEVLTNCTYNGELYSLPYFLFIKEDVPAGTTLDCFYAEAPVCTIHVSSTYSLDYSNTAVSIFNTSNIFHPGVADLYSNLGKYCVSGTVNDFDETVIDALGIPYLHLTSTPEYAFQSRNPPHVAHEKIIRSCLSKGSLVYTTPYSTTSRNDYDFKVKLACYKKMQDIYNLDILITLLPRVFAGPREALQNVLLLRNFGCKHFVMGRGKNCVGNFYTQTESYEFCKKYEDLAGVEIIYEGTQYDRFGKELKASSIKSTYIDIGTQPPSWEMSPYISEILLNG